MTHPTKEPEEQEKQKNFLTDHKKEVAFLVGALATAATLKKQGFSFAFMFYPKGGYGFNVYKYNAERAKDLRFFAIDRHPIWLLGDKTAKTRLHFHMGEKFSEIRKHRPYQ